MGKWVVLLGLCLLTPGCASLAPFAGSISLPGTSTRAPTLHSGTVIELRKGNFVTVKSNLEAESSGFKLLGLITIVPARLSVAMNRLYLKADLTHGKPQVLANVVTEETGSFYILFSIPQVTARADVVEFSPVGLAAPGPADDKPGG